MNFIDIEIPFDEAENYFKPNNREKLNKLFYKDKNYDKLLLDTTYYLIGEKGSGKTTYCAYFCNNTVNNTRSNRYAISVDDYNKIIRMKNEGTLNYTHYLTLWKAILLTKLLASVDENEISLFHGSTLSKIRKLLEQYNFTKITKDTFSPVSFMDNIKFSESINGNIGGENASCSSNSSNETTSQRTVEKFIYEDNWIVFINKIAEDLEKLRLKNNHYLFIDGIDTRPNDIPYDEYKECIYPLVRAVYELNSDILSRVKDRKKGRLQIILLTRLDIFLKAGLSNPGSKIADNSAFLDWSVFNEREYRETALYGLANKLLASGTKSEEQITWDSFFNFSINRGSNQFPAYNYFVRLTTAKPRDLVKILKITKEQCERAGSKNPSKKIIESDMFQRAYSTYFVDVLRTALSFYYNEPNIRLLFDFIKSIRMCKFTYSMFETAWTNFGNKSELEKIFNDPVSLLELLFNFNLIAVYENNEYYRWKYRETTMANYDYNLQCSQINGQTKFMFHWAAEKEFGLYLR